MFYNFMFFVGLYVSFYYLYDNLKSPINMIIFLLRKFNGSVESVNFIKRYGKWAVLTGATDGIGKAYARELAKRGLNLILISRSYNKLEKTAAELETDFKIEIQIVQVDFAVGPKAYKLIETALGPKEVGIVVNNVGQNFPGMLATLDSSEIRSIIYTNVCAVTHLSAFFIRRMRNQGIRGAIINISSGTELQPTPFAVLYAASKAFTRSLTISLQTEAQAYGITVQLVSPGFVRTKINSHLPAIMRGGILIPEPETYAAWAIGTLGVVEETTGYIWHGFQTAFIKLFPWQLRTYVSGIGLQYLSKKKLTN